MGGRRCGGVLTLVGVSGGLANRARGLWSGLVGAGGRDSPGVVRKGAESTVSSRLAVVDDSIATPPGTSDLLLVGNSAEADAFGIRKRWTVVAAWCK